VRTKKEVPDELCLKRCKLSDEFKMQRHNWHYDRCCDFRRSQQTKVIGKSSRTGNGIDRRKM